MIVIDRYEKHGADNRPTPISFFLSPRNSCGGLFAPQWGTFHPLTPVIGESHPERRVPVMRPVGALY